MLDIIVRIWESTFISEEGLWALIALGVFALLFMLLTLRALLAGPFAIRILPVVERIRAGFGRAMETGEPVHVALGTGGLGDLSTADTLAGLSLVSYLAQRGAVAEVPLRVRVAEPTALAGALAVLQQGAVQVGYPDVFDPAQAEFVAPTPLAYATGVADAIRREPMVINAMIGRFGAEALLPAEAGIRRGLTQVGGTSIPSAIPLLGTVVPDPLVGEEVYAVGAALGQEGHTGSLVTQDVFRVLLALGIVAITVLGLVGI